MANSERKRLLFEGFVIVASILAAFALDRWWDSAQARADEQATLEALDIEFRAAKTDLEATLENHRRIRSSVAFVRSSLADALRRGESTTSLPDTALAWLYIPPTSQVVLGTLDGLVGSAGLGTISDPELRAALAAWGNRLGEMNEEEWSSRELVFTDLDRVFRVRANVDPFRWLAKDVLDGTLTSSQASGTSTVRVDGEILGVVATRYAILDHALDEFPPVFDEIDDILRLIARSRAN